MKQSGRFSVENIMLSVCGHLALLALTITSVVLVVERNQLVAPDRIEIFEIDLDAVRVSGDETMLYNAGNPTPVADVPEEMAPTPESKPEPVPVAETEPPVPLESPSMVEELVKEKPEPEPEPEPQKEPEKKPEAEPKPEPQPEVEKPAPKKKTVVRVNRSAVSLDRTLTISVVDALRVAMTRCWNIDTTRADVAGIRAVAHLTMRKNGTVRDVWFESAARAETDAAFAYVLDTIRDAINVCQPLRMLPANEFSKWEKIELTFYPSQGKVM